MIYRKLKRLVKNKFCKRCNCHKSVWHRHWILDKDDPQFEEVKK